MSMKTLFTVLAWFFALVSAYIIFELCLVPLILGNLNAGPEGIITLIRSIPIFLLAIFFFFQQKKRKWEDEFFYKVFTIFSLKSEKLRKSLEKSLVKSKETIDKDMND